MIKIYLNMNLESQSWAKVTQICIKVSTIGRDLNKTFSMLVVSSYTERRQLYIRYTLTVRTAVYTPVPMIFFKRFYFSCLNQSVAEKGN